MSDYDHLPPFRLLTDAMQEVIDDVLTKGLHEALGLAPLRPGMYVDPAKCQCGGGCESVLECEFWYYVRKADAMERKAARQVKIGEYRVDSLFDCDGRKVVVELDGKAFHLDKRREFQRDTMLLCAVDCIVHIPYAAMHFYPRATFRILGEWFRRFELRGRDVMCSPASGFRAEMERAVHPDGDFPTPRHFLEWAEPNYELWHMTGDTIGWVGSPKAWLEHWDVTPIVRRDACERDRERVRAGDKFDGTSHRRFYDCNAKDSDHGESGAT